MDRRSIPKTDAAIRSLVRQYSRAGINVLFPEAIYNGYSAYPSTFLAQQDLWDGVDMLAVVVDEAHRQGMEVHPWVWVFRVGHADDKGGLLPRYPQWMAVDRHGLSNAQDVGYWLSPCSSTARRLLVHAICEVAQRYPVDGIHLDYIRFPSTDYGYDPACRARFQARYGMNPADIQPFTTELRDWYLSREDCVNSFVSDLRRHLRIVRPDAKLSASVSAVPGEARLQYLQNWEHWVENKWVDFLCPMAYSNDPVRFRRLLEQTHYEIAGRTIVVPGIGLQFHESPERMMEQIAISRSLPTAGVALFCGSYLDEAILHALKAGPFRAKADVPLQRPTESAAKLAVSAARWLESGDSGGDATEARDSLRAASALIEYAKFQESETGFVPPKPPPVFVPGSVDPIPEIEVALLSSAPLMDGYVTDAVWQEATMILLDRTQFGCPAGIATTIRLAQDREFLYIGAEMPVCLNETPRAVVTEQDGPVFTDDSLEIFLAPGNSRNDYFHLALNSLGVRYDARVYDTGIAPDWKAAVRRGSEAWTAEISIPFSALGISSHEGDTLRANFCRNRVRVESDGAVECTCWSPTYGSYHTPVRFGRVSLLTGGEVDCAD